MDNRAVRKAVKEKAKKERGLENLISERQRTMKRMPTFEGNEEGGIGQVAK